MRIMNIVLSLFSITSALKPNSNPMNMVYKPVYTQIQNFGTMSYSNKLRKRKQNKIKSDKKLITISPGGLQAFYMIGTCKYIKDNYKLNNSYIYSGASAGSWNSLFMTFNGNNDEFIEKIFEIDYNKVKNIFQIEKHVKNKLLEDYRSNDFDLDRLYIPVSIIRYLGFYPRVYYNFTDLEDAIECCIASSHIPFVTGGLFKKYNNIISFDGGIIKDPYPKEYNRILNINPGLWNRKSKDLTYFNKKNLNIHELFEEGYSDAYDNKEFLDNIFN